jgi:glycosyltransferase involved in cell wall biosynthesis
MNVLFLHQNFPGQYLHIARHLAASPGHSVRALTQACAPATDGIDRIQYTVDARLPSDCHPFTGEIDRAITTGHAVAEACQRLAADGYRPDLIVGHSGWGEMLYVADAFPDVPTLGNFEFYYQAKGADVGFDPEYDSIFNSPGRLRTRNTTTLLSMESLHWGHTATHWQKALHPAHLRDRLSVLHEGIDTRSVAPASGVSFELADGRRLTATDEVITYVARNLEPYRGFHIFMRALPDLLKRRPKAQVVIVGGDEVSYGTPPPPGQTFREVMLAEVGDRIDRSRVHFMGQIAYGRYLRLLQVSSAHVYLTYPFVLSWSFLEAMAAGCLVIGSATAPVLEVLEEGVNGLCVDFFSPDALSECLDKALTDREGAARLRAAARQTVVERYDLTTRQLPRWMSLFEDLVAGRTPQAAYD